MHHLLNAIIISSWILGDFLFTKMGFLCQVNARFTYYAISLLKIFLLLAASSPSCQSHFKFFFLKIQFLALESQYQSLYIHFVTSAMILGWVDLTDFIIRMIRFEDIEDIQNIFKKTRNCSQQLDGNMIEMEQNCRLT